MITSDSFSTLNSKSDIKSERERNEQMKRKSLLLTRHIILSPNLLSKSTYNIINIG